VRLKDIAPEGERADEDGWADVGFGTINWTELFPDIKNIPAKHIIVEHDNPTDVKCFAENSYSTIQSWGW